MYPDALELLRRVRLAADMAPANEPGTWLFGAIPATANGNEHATKIAFVTIGQALGRLRSSARVMFESAETFRLQATKTEVIQAIDVAIEMLSQRD